jgi:cyanophycin synthetase
MSNTQLNASSRIMYHEALKMGITCTVFSDNETILMKKDGHQFFTRGSRTSLQSSVGKTIADYKPLTKEVLHHFQLPTPASVLVKTAEDLPQLSNLQFPIVMKPVDERHGKGVVVGIKDSEEAKAAYQEVSGTMLFEEMLRGTEFRILCVNYTFIAAAFRKPAHVLGNGTDTIRQLIDQKNTHPWRGKGHQNNLSLIEADKNMEKYLAEQNLTLNDIPEKDQEVLLRKTANLSTGGEAWDVTDQVSAENKKLFEDIARACDLNVIGIDLMCQNLDSPVTSQSGAGVIEVNASPGLRMHHYPMKGQPINAAQIILEMVFNNLAQLAQ